MLNPSFWKNKKVFITGHTGFKGSWISLWLGSMGARIKGFSLDVPTIPGLYEVANVSEMCEEHQRGDIRDCRLLYESIKSYQPDIVIHMAAQPLVRFSYSNPVETYQTNVIGTVHLLDAVRRIDSVHAVICVTSDKCYENREWIWGYRETDSMGGYDPYSSSKGCAELVVNAYRNSYFNADRYSKHGVAVASVRAGNVIGGGDWAPERLVPDILKAFAQKEKVIIRNPKAQRPWQHVLEPLSGYLMLAENLYRNGPEFNGGWNFGPPDTDTVSVQYIVETLSGLWPDKTAWHFENHESPHEADFLKLDCSKAARILGWRPRWNLSSALERIVSWHQAWLADDNMQLYSLNEIKTYTNSIDYS